jgi:hypothetical protein
VIAYLIQHGAVSVRNFGDVRRIDHYLAAIGNYRFQLVHALAADPEIVIHLRHDGQDATERALYPANVDLGGEIGSRRERLFRAPCIEAGQAGIGSCSLLHHHCKAELGARDHGAARS